MTEDEPKHPNFTIVGGIAAAVIIAGYVFMLQTSGFLKEMPKAEPLRVQTEQAKALQQR